MADAQEKNTNDCRDGGSPEGIDVTVAIMSFNNARYLNQTIDSILSQEGVRLEVIVRDDCSTDDSLSRMEAFAQDPRFRLEVNERNLGMIANFNRCLDSGSGRYVIVLGSDDLMAPGHLSSLVAAMDAHPQAALGYVQCNWIDAQGQLIRYADHPGHTPQSYSGGRNEVAALLSFDNYITPSAMMLRRSKLGLARLPDGSIHADMLAGDWDLAIRMAEVAPDFVFLRQPSISYRIHDTQISSKFYASVAPLDNHVRILEGVFDRGHQDLMRGSEKQIRDLLLQRLAAYPEQREKDLGRRAERLCQRIAELSKSAARGPLFSVILTTYNRPVLLKHALDSLEKQIQRDFEVVLVNDHGEPVEHVLAAGYGFPITYIRQGVNQGLSAARNAGLKIARGRYVTYLDDDDIYLPNHLQVLADAFKDHPYSVLYTDVDYVNEKLRGSERIEQGRSRPLHHRGFDRDRLLVSNYIPVNTWAHPRSAIADVGEFDTSLSALEDWDMLLRLVYRHTFIQVPVLTAEVRTRVGTHASDHMLGRERKNFLGLYQELYRRYPVTDSPKIAQERKSLLEGLQAAQQQRVAPTLRDWLVQRALNAAQIRQVSQQMEKRGEELSVAIFIRTACGPHDASLVQKTLASLGTLRPRPPFMEVHLLGEPFTQPDGDHPDIQVHHLPTAGKQDELLAINRWVQQARSRWFLVLDAGEELLPAGLQTLMLEAAAAPCHAMCADEIVRAEDGTLGTIFRPHFNLDMLLSCPAGLSRHWVFQREAFAALGGFDAGYAEAPEFELLLRIIETHGMEGLLHAAEPLLITDPPQLAANASEMAAIEKHLAARGYADARVDTSLPGRYQIHYGHADQPLASILIAATHELALLQRCLERLLENTGYPRYEVIIADAGCTDEATRLWLDSVQGLGTEQIRVLRSAEAQGRWEAVHGAAQAARGDYFVLLSPTTAVLNRDWLDELLNHAQRPEVGAVGAKLLSADGRIQNAGLVLGLNGAAGSPFQGVPAQEPGYMHRLEIDQNYSAVSGDCLVIHRAVYESVGGLDTQSHPSQFADVDLCLKVRQAGFLIVWTPRALLLQSEDNAPGDAQNGSPAGIQRQEESLYQKWLPAIARDDAYNSNLSLLGAGFDVETDAIANRRPLPWHPAPVVLALAADAAGCGHYRVMEPVRAMHQTGIADARFSGRYFRVEEVERLQPDAMVLQRQVTEQQIELIQRLKRLRPTFMVAELDDYLPNLPMKNAHRHEMPKDVLRHLRRSVGLMDRFVVSTHALAEAFAGFHDDMRVVQNRLPPRWWRGLQSSRRTGGRPRVGWAGGISHQGDLELIVDVVKALHGEVDWIFFGMAPEAIKPYLREFHGPVSIERYPRALANLNLDLALAPLEQNLFNECKSNLRLLEYGACGYPVVCSDVRPYQCGLPVTRVKNRFKDWVDAIRMHTQDLDAAGAAGDRLKAAVESDWMLEGRHLEDWLSAWLPDGTGGTQK